MMNTMAMVGMGGAGMNRVMDRMFRPVDNVVWDISTGGRIGFSADDGIYSIDLGKLTEDNTEAPDAQICNNPFDEFGFAAPAFAQSTATSAIALGDMIFSSASKKVLGWVVKKNEKSFKLMKIDGTRSDWTPPKVNMMGVDSGGGVMVVRSLMNMLPGGENQVGQMGNFMMMLPMMAGMMGGDGTDTNDMMKQMMPMMLISQMNNTSGDASSGNNMMMQMMQMQMMSRMMNQLVGGNSNANNNQKKITSTNNNKDSFFNHNGKQL